MVFSRQSDREQFLCQTLCSGLSPFSLHPHGKSPRRNLALGRNRPVPSALWSPRPAPLFDFCCSPLLHSAQPGQLTALRTQTDKAPPSGAARRGRAAVPPRQAKFDQLRHGLWSLELAGFAGYRQFLVLCGGKLRFAGKSLVEGGQA